tara:strand:- start:187 stop:393 length:207 start_codon:yes stop_codon:yes gene_type:complete
MDTARRAVSLQRNGSQDLIKRQNKSWGQKREQNLKIKYLPKSGDKTGDKIQYLSSKAILNRLKSIKKD